MKLDKGNSHILALLTMDSHDDPFVLLAASSQYFSEQKRHT